MKNINISGTVPLMDIFMKKEEKLLHFIYITYNNFGH